jgi:hypothetical protein
MKILKYKTNLDPTKDAHQLCKDLEISLGVKLMVDDPDNPNEVQGYFNTSSDGAVEVCLYENDDITRINISPEHLKSKAFKKKNILKKTDLSDEEILTRCDNHFTGKGFTKHII